MVENNFYHSLGIFSRRQIDIFLIFPRKWALYISCKLRDNMHKMSHLFSGKNKKKYCKMSIAEIFTSIDFCKIILN